MCRNKKTILFIAAVFPPEQVTSALLHYDIVKELVNSGYEVVVLRPKPTRPYGSTFVDTNYGNENFQIININSFTCPQPKYWGRLRESVSFGKKCVKYIKKNKNNIDFIYNGSWQLFGVYMVAKIAVKYHIPYLVTIQDIYPESLLTGHNFPSILKWFIKKTLMPLDKYYTKNAVKVRTISNEMAVYMSRTRRLPQEHYLVLNNWQNDEDFENIVTQTKRNKKLIFAYVGSINVHANVDLIIRAFHEACMTNTELHIYGSGDRKKYCMELANHLGCRNIIFEQVDRSKVPYVQASADVLVLALPKGNGGLCLPSKMTSYMLSGKPILASIDDSSAAVRYIEESGGGIAVKPDCVESMKLGFCKFREMTNDELNAMSYKSKKFAEDNLTRKVNLPQLINVIKQVLSQDK